MSSVVIKSDASNVTVSLRQFSLSLGAREELLGNIARGQLVSVRRTFREEGSPAGSWMPLSAASRSWRKYSTGHKLLVLSGKTLNSIQATTQGNSAIVGTGYRIAVIQFEGFDGEQSVKPYSYTRRQQITDKNGKSRAVRRKISSGITTVNVSAFTRHIHIPARNPLVFRPEDPARIQSEVETWVTASAKRSGLEAKG